MFVPPKESREYPGFYEIKDFPGFVISKDGLIINCYQHSFVPRFYQPNGYITVSIGLGRKERTRKWLHILVAETFIPKPSDDPNLQVNHIDGDKYNARASNLEWCTPQENTWHAGMTGLSDKCTPVQVRNSTNGDISVYPSQREAAKANGIDENQFRYMMKFCDNGRRIFASNLQIRKFSDDPWPIDSYVAPLDTPIEVDVRNLLTGEEFKVYSLKDLAQLLNHTYQTLSLHLNSHTQPVYEQGYQIKLPSDQNWREPGDLILEVCHTLGLKPVQMYDPITGESRVFACKRSCERLTGISAGTLINYLRVRSGNRRRYQNTKYAYGYYPIHPDMSLPFEKLEW